MKIKSETDFWSGVMFAVVGLAFAVLATEYDYGTPQRMGPAYFPTMLGGLLLLIGVYTALKGLAREEPHGHNKIGHWDLKSVAWVTASIVAYGLLLRPAGLIVANVVLVVISMMGSHEFKWKEAVALSIVMGLIVYGVFIYALKLTIPVLPAFMSN